MTQAVILEKASMKILIVDDDMVDRTGIVRTLKRSDSEIHITEAANVDEGLALYQAEQFDVVLLDYRMPQRDGIEMVMAMRSEAKGTGVAIVMMSNLEEEQLALDCLKAGAQDFIAKSEISAARLRRAIAHGQTRFELEKELRQSYEKVKQLAESDSLTGLANRYLFDESLKLSIASNYRENSKLGLLLMDLDRFKYINDTHGHDVGDLLLQRVVKRIRSCLRGSELFARLGGDEFAITITNLHMAIDASRVAERIIKILEKPFEINGITITVGISIGIAIHPENGSSSEELFKFADIAMYRAKKLGHNQVCFFEDDMQVQLTQRYVIEQQLRSALKFDRREFVLHYHPCIEPTSGKVLGAEALIRWQYQDELRYPDTFIPIAEDTREIIHIGRWVVEEALTQLTHWNKFNQDFCMAVNLSAVQLYDSDLPAFIADCLQRLSLNPTSVEFELTETALLDNTSESIAVLNGISALGCHVALDDFGTGFSSISHLRNFPLNTVKIDRSLMPCGEEDDKTIALIKGLTAMIHSLGLMAVAEGIETQEHAKLCVQLHVEKVQGYFYTKPITSSAFEQKYFAVSPAVTD